VNTPPLSKIQSWKLLLALQQLGNGIADRDGWRFSNIVKARDRVKARDSLTIYIVVIDRFSCLIQV
jgi:hypothetical protein